MPDPVTNPYTGTLVFSAFSPVLPEPPQIPESGEIFDRIMGKIEPELTTKMLPTLETKYKDETPEQHEARQERYKRAMEEYRKEMDAYMTLLQSDISQYERNARELGEFADKQAESAELDSITSAISNF